MASDREKREFGTGERWLNFALVLGPAAWLLHLNVSYMLVPESCGEGSKAMLHGVTIVCVVLAVVAAAIAWKIRVAALAGFAEVTTASGSEVQQMVRTAERTRWLAMMVFILSLSMVLVIVAQQIPNFMLRSCD